MDQPTLPTVPICGLSVLALSPSEVADELVRRVEAGIGTRVVTLNVEMIARSRRDPTYAEWLRTADMLLPDGMPIVWAMRKKRRGDPRVTRVTGVDLTQEMIRRTRPERIGIIGGKDPRRALELLRIPGIDAVHINASRIEAGEEAFDLLGSEFAGARLIFLALGVPKQDVFAIALRSRIPGAVLIPNGGSFELLAGLTPRAPRWMQLSGLEWLFRLAVEPRRLWRRYLVEYWSGVIALLGDRSVLA